MLRPEFLFIFAIVIRAIVVRAHAENGGYWTGRRIDGIERIITKTGQFVTKLRDAGRVWSEYIPICGPSPKVQMLSMLHDSGNIAWRERYRIAEHRSFRAEERGRSIMWRPLAPQIWKSEVIWQRIILWLPTEVRA